MRIWPFRLLPTIMIVGVLALGIKLGDIFHTSREIGKTLLVRDATAETSEEKKDNAEHTAAAEKPAAENAEQPATAEETADVAKSAESGKEGNAKEAAAKPKGPSPTEVAPSLRPQKEYTQVELDLLQSLAKRREQIDSWAKELELKQSVLEATEMRINDKIATLTSMKKEMEVLVSQYQQQEDTQISSLVKIYENMKPAEAARIFEEMDMPILLLVVDRMSERKAAPILANMTPKKAKELTIQLAEQRQVKRPRVTEAANAAAAANP